MEFLSFMKMDVDYRKLNGLILDVAHLAVIIFPILIAFIEKVYICFCLGLNILDNDCVEF